ncbi:unnamed protein product [Urochloa humidicola]
MAGCPVLLISSPPPSYPPCCHHRIPVPPSFSLLGRTNMRRWSTGQSPSSSSRHHEMVSTSVLKHRFSTGMAFTRDASQFV